MKRNSPCKTGPPLPRKKTATGMAAMFLLAALMFSAPYLLAAKNNKGKNKSSDSSKTMNGLPVQALTGDEAILQALNRLGFGPSPGDLERVKQMGLQQWVDQQLH